MKVVFLFALVFSVPATASAADAKHKLGQRIFKACQSDFMEDYKNHRKICRCVESTLVKKLSEADLELLAGSYEGDEKAETKLQDGTHDDLMELDSDTVDDCVERHE